jgi:hypothetical protein
VELLLNIGIATEKALAYVGGLSQLLGRALAHAIASPLKRSHSIQRASHQAMVVGVSAFRSFLSLRFSSVSSWRFKAHTSSSASARLQPVSESTPERAVCLWGTETNNYVGRVTGNKRNGPLSASGLFASRWRSWLE